MSKTVSSATTKDSCPDQCSTSIESCGVWDWNEWQKAITNCSSLSNRLCDGAKSPSRKLMLLARSTQLNERVALFSPLENSAIGHSLISVEGLEYVGVL